MSGAICNGRTCFFLSVPAVEHTSIVFNLSFLSDTSPAVQGRAGRVSCGSHKTENSISSTDAAVVVELNKAAAAGGEIAAVTGSPRSTSSAHRAFTARLASIRRRRRSSNPSRTTQTASLGVVSMTTRRRTGLRIIETR